MSRRMDYVLTFDAPAEKTYQDLTSRRFWEAVMTAYSWLTTQSEITHFHSDEGGTDIAFKQLLPRSELPPIARAVMPVDMVVNRQQRFEPFDHGANTAAGKFRATVPGGPGHFSGDYFLSETATGSQLRLAGVCKVHIPLVGGVLEQLILSNITMLFDAEEAFMADWIAKHH